MAGLTCTMPIRENGEVAEWLKALVSKTSDGVIRSGVRISPSPPLVVALSLNLN